MRKSYLEQVHPIIQVIKEIEFLDIVSTGINYQVLNSANSYAIQTNENKDGGSKMKSRLKNKSNKSR